MSVGTKRIFCVSLPVSVPSSRRAVAAVTVPKAFQVVPLSVEYCQVPLVLSTAVTAMALIAVPSWSVMAPVTRLDTAAPVLSASATSSAMPGKAGDGVASSTGAKLSTVSVRSLPVPPT